MKRVAILFLTVFLLFSLTACFSSESTASSSTYEKDGFTVNTESCTITKGEDVYHYTLSGSGNSSGITITYPNGAKYYFTWSGNTGMGGWSDDYDPERYVDGDTLSDLISFGPPKSESSRSGSPLFGLICIALGLFSAIAPETAWYLEWGWRYKNADPSDAALFFERLGGIVAIIIGAILMFV